ncbi:hypothetical protein EST38_g2096 [Candolleomyces aberdarensis]|uniref:polynucleotide adenylyltransferase n=1 Tax=Candolleomyces aberdarensis TaxID=2316362 RepID=A0A4Q2DVS3_9AGAR|nr:hypothetical protein EST38_g2096 [Candolleomyces aberdarensis]
MPTKDEIALRQDLIDRFTTLIKKTAGAGTTVRPVGSCITGLFFPTSDIDMVMAFSPLPLSFLQSDIRRSGFASKIDSVLNASVPLLRITDAVTGLEIDLTAADGHGERATNAVRKWVKEDASDDERRVIKSLVMVLKMFLSIRRLGTTYTGGINSYVLVWMVVAWVKLEMPKMQARTSATNTTATTATRRYTRSSDLDDILAGINSMSISSHTLSTATASASRSSTATTRTDLGSALLGFLRFYGQEFDYANKSIKFTSSSVRYDSKYSYATQRYLLSITDPADSSVDMGSKAYGIKHVRETFRDAYDTLGALIEGTATRDQRAKARVEGVLGCWLGGQYSQFVSERKRIIRRWRAQRS